MTGYSNVDDLVVDFDDLGFLIDYLAQKHGDFHCEFHMDTGWQVSSCYVNGDWSDDGWVSSEDGTLKGAVKRFVELTKPNIGQAPQTSI